MKTALVTGASRGIGKAIATLLAENNYQVIATSTTGKSTFEHENVAWFHLDLINSENIEQFVQKVTDTYKSLDLLINNAAVALDKNQQNPDILIDVLEETLKVNVYGLIDLTQKLLGLFKPKSLIINTSSKLGSLTVNHDAQNGAYKISKAAVNMFTKVLAARLVNSEVAVIAYSPGWVKTDMGGDAAPKRPEDVANDIIGMIHSYDDLQTGMFYFEGEIRSW